MRIKQLEEINLYPSEEQKFIHSNLVNKYYNKLDEYPLINILNWIRLLIYNNKKVQFYPILYFNNEWYIRLNNVFKLRKNKKIFDIYNFSKIKVLMGKKMHIYDIAYYYLKN